MWNDLNGCLSSVSQYLPYLVVNNHPTGLLSSGLKQAKGSMVKKCCTRAFCRVIFNPLVWICFICACALVMCICSFHGSETFYRTRPGWRMNHEKTTNDRPRHHTHRHHHHLHRGRGPNRNPNNADYAWYENQSGSSQSLQNIGKEETPEIIEGVSCRLESNKELNAVFQDRTGRIDIRMVEDEFFGPTRNYAVLYVDRMRAVLDMIARLPSSRYFHHTGYQRENEKGMELHNYTYYAGGHWRPANCEPRWRVAIVIPFRDRYEHLAVLLRNVIPLMKLQMLEFRIFVAEQANSLIFNRGLMKNVGYVEATRFGSWDCVIFHDIDQIPMRGANYYGCEGMPRHMCARPEEMGFKPAYELLFGGVVGVTAKQMKESNGYSNFYWGWGGEDDDLLKRLYKRGYKPTRDLKEGFYRTLNHTKKTKSELCDEVYCLLDTAHQRMRWDGINNMTYASRHVKLSLLYTHILVDVKKEVWNSDYEQCQESSEEDVDDYGEEDVR